MLIVDRRTYFRPKARAFDKPGQRKRDCHHHHDEEQPIGAEVQPQHTHLSTQKIRQPNRLLLRAEEPGRASDGHEDKADAEQDLIEMRRAVETAIEQALEDNAGQRGNDERHRQRGQKWKPQPGHGNYARIAAEHGERAVGEIDEIHEAHGHRQADADDE